MEGTGGRLYLRQLRRSYHVTKIDHAYEADAFFPNLDEMPEWQVTGESDEQTYFDLEYQFVRYERK